MHAEIVTMMTFTSLRNRITQATDLLARVPLSAMQALFRVAVASVFLKAGLNKLASWELTVQLFADEYKVPLLSPDFAAAMSTTFEVGCSLLLIVGMIAVIQIFVYPSAYSEHLTWASILIFLLTRGGGAWSLDRLFGIEAGARLGG